MQLEKEHGTLKQQLSEAENTINQWEKQSTAKDNVIAIMEKRHKRYLQKLENATSNITALENSVMNTTANTTVVSGDWESSVT